MSSNNEVSSEDIQNFCSVTGASTERARFFIEASNGNLDIAIESFFEGGGETNDDVQEIAARPATHPSSGRPGAVAGAGAHGTDSSDEDDEQVNYMGKHMSFGGGGAAGKPSKEAALKPRGDGSKIFTLNQMRGDEDNEDDEDEDEKGQAFYAGGSRTSGQQILGPPKKKNPEKIIKDLFEKAKESGAQEVESSEPGRSSGPVVYGTGYRLGTGNEPSEVIAGPSRPKPPKVNILKLWKNGFTVDDGPLRTYEDPRNKEFLAAIQQGVPPRELIRAAGDAEVHLDMQDHRDADYEAPKGKYVLYNDGYKLGSPTPQVVSNATPADQASSESQARAELAVDDTKPTTQIQVRLSDGSRLVIKANQTHTVSQIRRYINRARPEYNQRNYQLMTSFPNKEITNNEQTLQQAQLLNAVIIQKL